LSQEYAIAHPTFSRIHCRTESTDIGAAEKSEPVGGLQNDEPLFGAQARVDFDSLDALQISMAIQKRYGVRMPDSKDTRRALESIAHLAEHLHQHLTSSTKPA
jgi:acyl carrier protein